MREVFIQNLWRWKCRLKEEPIVIPGIFDKKIFVHRLVQTEWNENFEKLMRNRLIMGAYRYGAMYSPDKKSFKNVESAIERLKLFMKDPNMEHLVDAANLCLLEFTIGKHPGKYFSASDDGVHTEIKVYKKN